jgi:ribosomal protein L12E/L44/L45/RPP1/RPP2
MDGRITGKPEGTGSHIWLHHTMQVRVGERTHTIEMDIPIPIGASADMREQLLNEAESSMEELASRIENREPRKVTRSQPSQADRAPSIKAPVSSGQSADNKATANAAPSTPAPTPLQLGAPAQPRGSIPTVVPISKETAVPPTRPNIGASMPSSPGMSVDTSGSLKLPQFIQFIKDTLDLSPKQAMELLNVKSLSGLNLREALEELQEMVGHDTASITTPMAAASQQPVESNQTKETKEHKEQKGEQGQPETPGAKAGGASRARDDQAGRSSPASSSPIAFPTAANPKNPDIIEITNAVIRDTPPSYAFDEEIDLESDGVDLEEEEEVEYVPELTNQERELGEQVLAKLREAHGSSTASDARLKVLHNVTDSQISEEQLLQLVQGIWGITALKKLKNDQVEALISWAKEDDFFSEAEIVLLLMQEEQYAGSDW